MAPVRRTLVATWMGEGSSSVAKIGVEGVKNSTGPPSSSSGFAVAVGSEVAWAASHGCLGRGE